MLVCLLISLTLSDKNVYNPPHFHFVESFDSLDNWVSSQSSKEHSSDLKYNGVFSIKHSSSGNGLLMESASSHHGISAKLPIPFDFTTNDHLYFQYQAQHLSKPDCGGAYIKLLSQVEDLTQLNDASPFTIMFGPDVCGVTANYFFILKVLNPKTGEFEEKFGPNIDKMTPQFLGDNLPHLYTLSLHSNGDFQLHIDNEAVFKGNIMNDMDPSVNPPEFIPDMSAKKPSDWDDRLEIIDESITKPDDYDEGGEEMIPDMDAVIPSDWKTEEPLMIKDLSQEKPDDWDDEYDGEWDPLIENPACSDGKCGEWTRPLKMNPNYKGPWKPTWKANPNYKGLWIRPNISNPDYYYEEQPFRKLSPITALGFELWTVEGNVLFDNIILTSHAPSLANWTAQTFPLPPSKIYKYGRNAVKYVTENWILVAAVVALLVLVVIIFKWLRSSPVPEETTPAEDNNEPEIESQDESGDEGARQRH